MRKLIFVFALLVAAIGLQAQDFTVYKSGLTQLYFTDTITNTEAHDTTILIKSPMKDREAWGICVQVNATNISGTTDLDINYQASMDGTNWHTLASDSIASGNMTYQHEDIDGFTAPYLKIDLTGVGTQSTSVVAWLNVFKVPGND